MSRLENFCEDQDAENTAQPARSYPVETCLANILNVFIYEVVSSPKGVCLRESLLYYCFEEVTTLAVSMNGGARGKNLPGPESTLWCIINIGLGRGLGNIRGMGTR